MKSEVISGFDSQERSKMMFETFKCMVYKYIKVNDGQKESRGCCEWLDNFNKPKADKAYHENNGEKLDKNNAEVFVNV